MGSCTSHKAFLYDRGGERRIGPLGPLASVKWSRVRDDVSAGRVIITTPDPACVEHLQAIEPGRHELVIFRQGERVWEGPITYTDELGPRMEIQARDVVHYTNRTAMRSGYNNAHPKIDFAVSRLHKILRHELARKEALEPPINVLRYLDVRNSPTGAKTSRKTLPYEKYVFTELDQMAAKSGIDYTTVGRSIIIWDTHEPIGYGRTLTEADFDGPLAVTTYGMELATVSTVTDGQGRWGRFGGVDDYYGEIELLHTTFEEGEAAEAEDELTQAEMVTQAKRNMGGRYPAPVVVRVPSNTGIRPDLVDELLPLLVPGVWFPVRATKTYRTVEQQQKLDNVTVEETAAGEKVRVTLSPVPGTTPWDDSGDTGDGGQE